MEIEAAALCAEADALYSRARQLGEIARRAGWPVEQAPFPNRVAYTALSVAWRMGYAMAGNPPDTPGEDILFSDGCKK